METVLYEIEYWCCEGFHRIEVEVPATLAGPALLMELAKGLEESATIYKIERLG